MDHKPDRWSVVDSSWLCILLMADCICGSKECHFVSEVYTSNIYVRRTDDRGNVVADYEPAQ